MHRATDKALHSGWNYFRALPSQYLNPPALALLVQLLSAELVLAIALIAAWWSWPLAILTLFFMQAVCAMLLVHLFFMASWWYGIHGIFPLLVWCMLQYKIPSNLYLGGLLLSVALFWTTFRSQVPYFPSSRVAHELVEKLLSTGKAVHMVDIGSGLGGLVLHLAAKLPASRISGIEIAPLPWLISYCRARFCQSSAAFRYGDYNKLHFVDYDVVFAYLSPAAMSALWQKAVAEMRPGSLLISYEFAIDNAPPSVSLQAHAEAPKLYVWHM